MGSTNLDDEFELFYSQKPRTTGIRVTRSWCENYFGKEGGKEGEIEWHCY